MKRIFVCSPYGDGGGGGNIPRNTMIAKALCRVAAEQGNAVFAPHLFYPQILPRDDQRDAGVSFGMSFLASCDEIWVWTGVGPLATSIKPPSKGMKLEIEFARHAGVQLRSAGTDVFKLGMDLIIDDLVDAGPDHLKRSIDILFPDGIDAARVEALNNGSALIRGYVDQIRAMGSTIIRVEN